MSGRVFAYQGSLAHERYSDFRSLLPLPEVSVLFQRKKLDRWSWEEGWQREPHPWICGNGASGECPAAMAFVQALVLEESAEDGFTLREVLIRIMGPDLLVLVNVTAARSRKWVLLRKHRIESVQVEWRLGEVPEVLLAEYPAE